MSIITIRKVFIKSDRGRLAIPGLGSGHGHGGAGGARNPRATAGYHSLPKNLTLATLNGRTLRLEHHLAQLEVELENIKLCGVHREGEDTVTLDSGHLLYFREGDKTSLGGVGFLVNKALTNIQEISSVSNRVAYLILRFAINVCTSYLMFVDGTGFKATALLPQDIWCWLLQWNCKDECGYRCMWQTVNRLSAMGEEVPKFYGKWPFKRLLGVQEPASAACSLLNLAANVYMYRKIRKEFPIRRTPLVIFWHVFAFICMHGWFWSVAFHTRDKPFTEFMDYACAMSMVMSFLIAAFFRLFHGMKKLAIWLFLPMCFYFSHVRYLYSGLVDYDYNMKINLGIGALGTGIWLGWACIQLWTGRFYARSMVLFTLASIAALSLELLDFPPVWGSWDAHALWHLATAPLPLLFYTFVIDDLRFLKAGQYEKLI